MGDELHGFFPMNFRQSLWFCLKMEGIHQPFWRPSKASLRTWGSMMIQTAKEKTSIVRTIFFQNCTYKEWIQLFTQLSHAFPRSKWGIAPKKVPCSYRQLGCTRGWSAKRTTLAASIKDTWLAGGWCVRKTCGFLACWRICCPQILWSRSPAICVVNYTA